MRMLRSLRPPSPAMVVAMIALFVALSGTAWAVATIGPGRNRQQRRALAPHQERPGEDSRTSPAAESTRPRSSTGVSPPRILPPVRSRARTRSGSTEVTDGSLTAADLGPDWSTRPRSSTGVSPPRISPPVALADSVGSTEVTDEVSPPRILAPTRSAARRSPRLALARPNSRAHTRRCRPVRLGVPMCSWTRRPPAMRATGYWAAASRGRPTLPSAPCIRPRIPSQTRPNGS